MVIEEGLKDAVLCIQLVIDRFLRQVKPIKANRESELWQKNYLKHTKERLVAAGRRANTKVDIKPKETGKKF